jgi:5'-nucleotidase
MRILLVNDDGIGSPGLEALRDALSANELWIAAPDNERSGASHSLTLSDAVRTREIDKRTFAVRGTPVDCVLIALQHMLTDPPDLVISGINIGANLGADIIYSGTAAAARQAVILGIPGVAVSLNTFTPPLYLGPAAAFISANVEALLELWRTSGDPSHFININVPNAETFSGEVVVAPPAKLTYENSITSFSAPGDEVYHFYNDTGRIGIDEDTVTDVDMVAKGNIVVSPVKVYPELSAAFEHYGSHPFKPR